MENFEIRTYCGPNPCREAPPSGEYLDTRRDRFRVDARPHHRGAAETLAHTSPNNRASIPHTGRLTSRYKCPARNIRTLNLFFGSLPDHFPKFHPAPSTKCGIFYSQKQHPPHWQIHLHFARGFRAAPFRPQGAESHDIYFPHKDVPRGAKIKSGKRVCSTWNIKRKGQREEQMFHVEQCRQRKRKIN